MQTFRVAHADQVQASIRELNVYGLELKYTETALGFDVDMGDTRIAIIAFWGTQPAIRVDNPILNASTLLIGADAVDLAGELVILFARQHNAR